MKSGKQMQALTNMPNRQKMTIGVIILVFIIIAWQVMGLFGGSAPTPVKTTAGGATPAAPTQSRGPQQVPVFTQAQLNEREAALMKLQKDTQDKYIMAVNELQLLKIEREIAENNKAIVSAKLDTVTAQKGILSLLSPSITQPAPGAFAPGLVTPALSGVPQGQPVAQQSVGTAQDEGLNYAVVSVSQISYKWNAVLGSGTNLYQVSIGDILPPDRSKVVSIDKTGVVLEKDGKRRKMSLVPII